MTNLKQKNNVYKENLDFFVIYYLYIYLIFVAIVVCVYLSKIF